MRTFSNFGQTVFLSLLIKLSKNDDDDHFRSGSRPSASTSAEPDIKIVATVPGQVVVDDHHGHVCFFFNHGHVDHNGFEDCDDHNAR